MTTTFANLYEPRPDWPVSSVDAHSHRVAQQVCALLPGVWRLEPTYNGSGQAYLRQYEGATDAISTLNLLWFTNRGPSPAYRARQRWFIEDAVWPRGDFGDVSDLDKASITVREGRTPAQIAALIVSRLLPKARVNHASRAGKVHADALRDHRFWRYTDTLCAARALGSFTGAYGKAPHGSPYRFDPGTGIVELTIEFGSRTPYSTMLIANVNGLDDGKLGQILDFVARTDSAFTNGTAGAPAGRPELYLARGGDAGETDGTDVESDPGTEWADAARWIPPRPQ